MSLSPKNAPFDHGTYYFFSFETLWIRSDPLRPEMHGFSGAILGAICIFFANVLLFTPCVCLDQWWKPSAPGGERLDHWSCEAAGRQTCEPMKIWWLRTNGALPNKKVNLVLRYIYIKWILQPLVLIGFFSWIWASLKQMSLSCKITFFCWNC